MDKDQKLPIFQLSYESEQLIKLLRDVEVGEVVTYEQMNECIGGDIRGRHRHALDTARRRLMQEDQIHFGTIWGTGIRRLSQSEATQSLDQDVSRVRTGARRVHRKTTLIDIGNLSQSERLKVAMVQTLTAVIERATTHQAQKRLSEAGENISLKKAFAALSGE